MPNTPTIKNLTLRQRTLVDTLVSQDISITKASEIAGYAKGESGRVVASKTLRLPHVQEYMMQQVGQHLTLSSISSVKRLRHLVDHARSEYVQLEASKDILDRVGFKQPDKVRHTLDGDISVKIDLS
jgi:phage terminase small subunit